MRPTGKRGFSKCLNPAAWVRAIHQQNSVIVTTWFQSMWIPISIRTSSAMADVKGLVDSEATDCFMSPTIVRRMGLGKRPLEKPRRIWNIDNTKNKDGSITHYVDLQVQTWGIHRDMRFLITNIGNEDIVLGYPWLATYKPKFSWKYATIDETILPIVLRSVNPQIPWIDHRTYR